jgi:hypothetical protein
MAASKSAFSFAGSIFGVAVATGLAGDLATDLAIGFLAVVDEVLGLV